MSSPWDDAERLQQLHKLWNDRLTVGVIADRLGVSPAAVTSKSRREELERRVNPSLPRLSNSLPQVIGRRLPVAKSTLPALVSVEGVTAPSHQPLALRRLPSAIGECCWPVNDGRPWRFCDAPTDPGHNYCATHRKAAREQGRVAATRGGDSITPRAAATNAATIESDTNSDGSKSSDVQGSKVSKARGDRARLAAIA